MPKWVPGQSGNPKGRPRRGRSAAEMARAVSQERVEFVDGNGADVHEAEKAVYSRLERLVRVLWTKALDGDLKSIRCLLEYMEGKPFQLVATVRSEAAGGPLTADQLFHILSQAIGEIDEWRKKNDGEAGASSKPNG